MALARFFWNRKDLKEGQQAAWNFGLQDPSTLTEVLKEARILDPASKTRKPAKPNGPNPTSQPGKVNFLSNVTHRGQPAPTRIGTPPSPDAQGMVIRPR